MRQLIIARKDLGMSSGKLAGQCCHASVAFLQQSFLSAIQKNASNTDHFLYFDVALREDIYREWMQDIYTKTICAAKNRNHLLKAVQIAESLGLQENKDFFIIKDMCLTELIPEEYDSNGIGCVMTCIGFRPLPDDIAHQISRKYQLYK